jgi:hypothetical protein
MPASAMTSIGDVSPFLRHFELHADDAAEKTGTGNAHDGSAYDSSQPGLRDLARAITRRWYHGSLDNFDVGLDEIDGLIRQSNERALMIPAALANIRKSIASGAITATHLHTLVQALRNALRLSNRAASTLHPDSLGDSLGNRQSAALLTK